MMVSVIILSYNTKDITLRCLKHLLASQGIDLEVIVVDNASSDRSADSISKKFPNIKLVRNITNMGFAVANNQQMEMSKGEVFLLLNSDCFVQPNTIIECVKRLDMYDVIGCKLLNSDGTIQSSWGYFPSLWRIFLLMTFVDNFPILRKFVHSIHVRDTSRYINSQRVDWVTGAYTLLKKEVFNKVGGIDEKYFMYGEEMEWMYRISKAGYKIGYVADAVATHLGGASTKSDATRLASAFKGYLYWFSKHNPSWQLPVLKFILLVGCAYKALAWWVLGKVLGKPG